jgi:hypothetical protein
VIVTKSILGVCSYHINGNIVPVYSQTDDRVITIPANTTLSLGKHRSRPDRELHWTRLGLVSIYERSLLGEEIKALYDDYKHHYQNIRLVTDAIAVYDLTDSNIILYDPYNIIVRDISGNENELVEVGLQEIEYVNDNSIKFSTPNNNMVTNLHILHGDIENTVNMWILVNKQVNSSIEKQRIFTIGTGETSANSSLHLTLVCTDTVAYALEFGVFNQYVGETDKLIYPDIWHNVTLTRNNVSRTSILYIDTVEVERLTNSVALNVDEFFSIGKYLTGSPSGYTDLKIAHIGTIGTTSIYERPLSVTEISDLYYMYNVGYLLKNSYN